MQFVLRSRSGIRAQCRGLLGHVGWLLAALPIAGAATLVSAQAATGRSDQSRSAALAQATPVVAEPEVLARLIPERLDPRRSLFITDTDVLSGFSLPRVLTALVEQHGDPTLSAIDLFRQLWDSQNPGPGLEQGAHCDDHVSDELGTRLNGFPYDCRPAPGEGGQAECESLEEGDCAYVPIAIINRFDLASADASTCGEYRIIHAKQTGQRDALNRNFIIWEGALPNPRPRLGVSGCRSIAIYWSLLSGISDPSVRAAWLERFYFTGWGEIPAVITPVHYGDNAQGVGQVRTNQFMAQGVRRAWTLREFKLRTSRSGNSLQFVPVAAADNPWGGLFASDASHPQTSNFMDWLPSQIDLLDNADPALIRIEDLPALNSGQSHASLSTDTNYVAQFDPDSELASVLQAELDNLGSLLVPTDIVARVQTQSCAGCHQLSNGASLGSGITWPSSLGFTHVSEAMTEEVGGVTRFVISDALIEVFLPARQANLEEFVRQGRFVPAPTGAVN